MLGITLVQQSFDFLSSKLFALIIEGLNLLTISVFFKAFELKQINIHEVSIAWKVFISIILTFLY